MLHSTGTWGYYLRNNDLLLHLSDLNNDLLFHSTEHLDALLKIITCSKQWKGALISLPRGRGKQSCNEIGSWRGFPAGTVKRQEPIRSQNFFVICFFVCYLFEQVEVLAAIFIQLMWTCYTHLPIYGRARIFIFTNLHFSFRLSDCCSTRYLHFYRFKSFFYRKYRNKRVRHFDCSQSHV